MANVLRSMFGGLMDGRPGMFSQLDGSNSLERLLMSATGGQAVPVAAQPPPQDQSGMWMAPDQDLARMARRGAPQPQPAVATPAPQPQTGMIGGSTRKPAKANFFDYLVYGPSAGRLVEEREAERPLKEAERALKIAMAERQLGALGLVDQMPNVTPAERIAAAFAPAKLGEALASGSERATLGRNDRSIFRGAEVTRNDAPADPQVVGAGAALVDANGTPIYRAPQFQSVGTDSRLVETDPGIGGTRADRNFNPGNIEDGAFAKSLPGYAGSDGRFARFVTPEAGRGAQLALLQSYGRRGFNTVSDIVGRWAPAEDGNDVASYSAFVAQRLGVRPDQALDLNNPQTAGRLADAMGAFEGANASSGGAARPTSAAPRVVVEANPKGSQNVQVPPGSNLKPLGNNWFRDPVGRLYQADSTGKMVQTAGVTDQAVKDATNAVTGLNTALAGVVKFERAVKALSPKDFGPSGKYLGDPAKFAAAQAAATELMMTLKGPDMFNLGVITGPDMSILEGVVQNPASLSALILRNQIVPKLHSLGRNIGTRYEMTRQGFASQGGDPDGLQQLYGNRREGGRYVRTGEGAPAASRPSGAGSQQVRTSSGATVTVTPISTR